MSRRAAITRAPKGGAITKDETKYKVGSDPLEIETSLKDMEPTTEQEHKEMLEVVNLLIDDVTDTQEQNALKIWKANLLASTIQPHVKKTFVRDFWAWLVGRATPEDADGTPWGRQALTDDPEVEAYVSMFPKKMQKYRIKLYLLANRRPLGINECFLFFKYIVRGGVFKGKEPDFNGDFLKDWATYGKDFDEARRTDGQEVRKPGGGAHEMAPYGDSAEKYSKERQDANKKPSTSGFGGGGGAGPRDQRRDDMDVSSETSEEEEVEEQKPRPKEKRVKEARSGQFEKSEPERQAEFESRMEEVLTRVLAGRMTPAATEAAGQRLVQEQSAKISEQQQLIARLQAEATFREQTRTGVSSESQAQAEKAKARVAELEAEKIRAEGIMKFAREEAERSRQEWTRQHGELVDVLKKLPAPVISIPTPAINVPQPPPGAGGAAAPVIVQAPTVDISALTKSVGETTAALNAANAKLSSFVDLVGTRMENLQQDINAGIGNSKVQLEEIGRLKAQLQDMQAKTAPAAALTNHPTAVAANIRAEDMTRLADTIEAGFGKRDKELQGAWSRLLDANDQKWVERLRAFQQPNVTVDTSSISTAVNSSTQTMMAEMKALQGTNSELLGAVRAFHEKAMGEFAQLGRATTSLTGKVERVQTMPADVRQVVPGLVNTARDAQIQQQFDQLQLQMQEEQRKTAVAQAALAEQTQKMRAELERQMAAKAEQGKLSQIQVEQLRSQMKKQEAKYNKDIGAAREQLRQAQARLADISSTSTRNSEEVQQAFFDASAENRRLTERLEKLETSYQIELEKARAAHVPVVAPSAPAASLPTFVEPPKEKEELTQAPAPQPKTLEELRAERAKEEEGPFVEEVPTMEEEVAFSQAQARGEVEEVFHPSALEEGELQRAAEEAGIPEFDLEEEASAPSLTETEEPAGALVATESTAMTNIQEMIEAEKVGYLTGELQLAVDQQPMKDIADLLMNAWRMIEAAGEESFTSTEIVVYGQAMELSQKAKATNASDLMPEKAAASVKETLGKAYQKIAKEKALRNNVGEFLSQTPLEKVRAKTEKPPGSASKKRGLAEERPTRGKSVKGKTAPPERAVKEFVKRFNQAEAKLHRDKVKLGAEMLQQGANAAKQWMLKNKKVPTVDQIYGYFNQRAAQVAQ